MPEKFTTEQLNLEQRRIAALNSYDILDTPSEKDYDELTELAAAICGTPIALISLVDESRQWFKSHIGLDARETERSQSFCAHAIKQPEQLMQIEDAQKDERFRDNPLVTGEPHICFYAGMPLVDADGHALGSLCVIDSKPRKLNHAQQQALRTLAKQVSEKLLLRKKLKELEATSLHNSQLHQRSEESELSLRTIIEQSPAAIIVFRGPDLLIDAVNPAMLSLLGQTKDIQGRTLLQAIPELKGQPAYELLEQVYHSGKTIERKHTPVMLQREGRKQTGYFDFTYAPLIENRKITGIMDMAVEVTDQFEARMAVEQSENQLRQMVMNAPMGMCIIRGQDLVIEIANQPMLSIWTRSAEQVLGKRLTDVFPEVVDQPYPGMLRAVLDTGETLAIAELTADIAQTDGTINRIYIDFTYKALKDSQGNPEAIMATVTDVTETVKARKLLEQSRNELQDANQELGSANEEYIALNEELVSANERLTQAQEELRDLNELINIAIDAGDLGYTEVDLASGSMRCNDNFKRFYNRSPDQQLTYPEMFEMMLPEHSELVRAKAIQAREQRSLYHAVYPIQWADGSIHWINAYGRGRYDDHGNADRMVGMVSEITEQKMAEQAIEKLNGELSNALEAAKESGERMDLAISAANMGTFHINLQTRELIATVRTRELFGFGSNEPMSLGSILSQIEENYRSAVTEAFKATLNNSAPFAIEFPVSGLHNQKSRWLRAVGRCYGSIADHAVEHFSGTVMDITDRKAEEQRKQDFIGIVSHEMRSPLTSLSGYVQLLGVRSQKAGDTASHDIALKAKRQVDRMAALISGFLDTSLVEQGKIYLERTSFDLSGIAAMAQDESLASTTIHPVNFGQLESAIVNADRRKIEQVLVNLVSNAIKYSPNGSAINVSCTNSGGNARISVSDQGMGIQPQDQAHIFDRFFRVLGAQTTNISGFGIGLYLCKEIIELHNGRIGVDSIPGQGSTFWFELPIENSKPSPE